MRNNRIQRLVVTGLSASIITLSVIAGQSGLSGAAVKAHSSSSTLTIPQPVGTEPTSVFPFYTGAECYTVNIDYWNLMSRPGYWFGLGSSIAEQPALSSLNQPSFSTNGSGDTVVTITTKPWKWTNSNSPTAASETQDAQEVVFWLNMAKAQEKQGANATCGNVPGFGIPDQVKTVTEPDGPTGNTVQITFTGAESHSWLIANELSQIDPMPTAWDTTNGTNNGGCSTEAWSAVTNDGHDQCSNVFNYLSGLQINDPIWNWADGPYRQQSAGYSSGAPDGNDVQIANTNYSGPEAAHAVKTIVYVPYSSVDSEIADLQSGKLDTGYLNPSDVKKSPGPGKAGAIVRSGLSKFESVGSIDWGVFYFMYNFGNSHSTWPTTASWTHLVNQQYIRGAMQQAVNQAQIDSSVNNGYSVPTYSAVPAFPKNSYATGVTNPYPYSIAKAKATLKAHGWSSAYPAVCTKSGTVGCGSTAYPILKGATLTLSVLVPSGIPSVKQQIVDEVDTMKEAGIKLVPIYQSQQDVGNACFGGTEDWELCAYGGWLYAPDYYPSGEVLFAVGSSSNSGGYDSAEMQTLVADTTISGNVALNGTNHAVSPATSFAEWSAVDDPFLWQPTPAGFGIVLKTIKGAQPPEPAG